ncbi:MAG TPA: serine hydrolase, partial [Gammaproteobacteria bacterium]|nr:serine hydrolase [Gammaproteobacteria bacterium]
RTHFHDDAAHPIRGRAAGYARADGDRFREDQFANIDKVGDGGLYSTVHDMYLWLRNFDEDRIGGPGFIEELTTPGTLNDGGSTGYGFGLSIGEHRGLRTVEHGGVLMGFRTHVIRFPEQRFATIVLCNIGEVNPGALARQVAELHLEAGMTPPAAVSRAADEPVTMLRPEPATLAVYAGTYRSPELRTDYRLTIEADRLVLSRTIGAPIPLRAPEPDVFVGQIPAFGPIELRFERDAQGGVDAFALGGPRIRGIVFTRTADAPADP